MKTNDHWKAKGSKNTSPFKYYQVTADKRLSEPKKFEDPYRQIKNSFRSSIGFKN